MWGSRLEISILALLESISVMCRPIYKVPWVIGYWTVGDPHGVIV